MTLQHINGNGDYSKIVSALKEQDIKLDHIRQAVDSLSRLESIAESLLAIRKSFEKLEEKIIDKALTKDDRIFSQSTSLIKTLCLVITLLILWFTGIKSTVQDLPNTLKSSQESTN